MAYIVAISNFDVNIINIIKWPEKNVTQRNC